MPGQSHQRGQQGARGVAGRRVPPSSTWRSGWPAIMLGRLAASDSPFLGVGAPRERPTGGLNVTVELGSLPAEQHQEARLRLLAVGHPSRLHLCVGAHTLRHRGTAKAYLALALKPPDEVVADVLDAEVMVDRLVKEGVEVALPAPTGRVQLGVRYRRLACGPDQVVVKVTNLDPSYARQGLLATLLTCAGYAGGAAMVAAEFMLPTPGAPEVGDSSLVLGYVRYPPGDPCLQHLPSSFHTPFGQGFITVEAEGVDPTQCWEQPPPPPPRQGGEGGPTAMDCQAGGPGGAWVAAPGGWPPPLQGGASWPAVTAAAAAVLRGADLSGLGMAGLQVPPPPPPPVVGAGSMGDMGGGTQQPQPVLAASGPPRGPTVHPSRLGQVPQPCPYQPHQPLGGTPPPAAGVAARAGGDRQPTPYEVWSWSPAGTTWGDALSFHLMRHDAEDRMVEALPAFFAAHGHKPELQQVAGEEGEVPGWVTHWLREQGYFGGSVFSEAASSQWQHSSSGSEDGEGAASGPAPAEVPPAVGPPPAPAARRRSCRQAPGPSLQVGQLPPTYAELEAAAANQRQPGNAPGPRRSAVRGRGRGRGRGS